MNRLKSSYLLVQLVALALLIGPGFSAVAQEKPYPKKSITYLVTFVPFGESDRGARRQQPMLEKILGQKIIFDHKVGGSGALGWSELVRSLPDGYFIAGIKVPDIILQPMKGHVGYLTEQITPVAIFQQTPVALAVLKTSPYNDVKEFLAAAKAKPRGIIIGGAGAFSSHHMATTRLQEMAGVKFSYIPFSGGAFMMPG
jgi:putative tricarboxylic transport membrane protein